MAEQAAAMKSNKLAGKVAIVTGGASGIGEATARLFSAHGARMVVIADIQDGPGEHVAASIGADQCAFVHCDITDENQVKALVESTVRKYDTLDVMFSNAGIVSESDQTLLELDFQEFDQLFAVNVRGMAACVKHAARVMVDRRVRGSIVCTGSVAASCGFPQWTDYSMSKHAVLGLVRSASVQLGVHGIRVNCVSPYALATPLLNHVLGMRVAEEIERLYEPKMVLKGKPLKTYHLAEAVLFLAADESELITGQNLVVDGGFLLSKV